MVGNLELAMHEHRQCLLGRRINRRISPNLFMIDGIASRSTCKPFRGSSMRPRNRIVYLAAGIHRMDPNFKLLAGHTIGNQHSVSADVFHERLARLLTDRNSTRDLPLRSAVGSRKRSSRDRSDDECQVATSGPSHTQQMQASDKLRLAGS